MPQTQFNLTNLCELDSGKANLAINHHIRQCVRDVQDRPGDKAKRKVFVEIEFTPALDEATATLDTVNVRIKTKVSVPVRQTKGYPMLPTGDGTLMFQPHSPENPRQGDLLPPHPESKAAVEEFGGDDEDDDVEEI